MQNKKPMISVIIPVYNAALFVSRILDDVIAQTYSNIEIICVDDGSTDDTLTILNEYANKDSRIHIIRKKNEGPHLARKAGLSLAEGEYVSCVDADDWQDVDRSERLLPAMIHGFDIIVTNAKIAYDDIRQENRSLYRFREGGYTRKEIDNEILTQPQEVWENPFCMPVPLSLWEAVFKREILYNAMCFLSDDMYMAEDSSCFFVSLIMAQSLFVTNDYSYTYYKRQGGLCHKEYTKEEERRVNKGLLALCRFHRNISEKLSFDLRQQLRPFMRQALYHSLIMTKCDLLLDDGRNYGSVFPFAVSFSSKLVIYGAGSLGQRLYRYLSKHGGNVVLWCDRSYTKYLQEGLSVKDPQQILESVYDYVIIAIERYYIAAQVSMDLYKMGVPRDKIRLIQADELTEARINRVLARLK